MPAGFRKREITFALGMGALAASGAAVTLAAMHDGGSANQHAAAGETRSYELAPFRQIAVSGSQDVEVSYGDTISVRADGSREALDRLEVTVADGKLSIRPKTGLFGADWDIFDHVTVHVTLPRLDRFDLEGSSDVRIDRIEGARFDGSVVGSGTLEIAALKVDRATFDIAGSGDLTAAGSAGTVEATVSGSGDIHAGALDSGVATVSVSGSGSIALSARKSAEVSLTGSGDIDISGPAPCAVTRTGSGNVSCASDGNAGTGDD